MRYTKDVLKRWFVQLLSSETDEKTESSNERKDMCSAICIYQLPDLLIEKWIGKEWHRWRFILWKRCQKEPDRLLWGEHGWKDLMCCFRSILHWRCSMGNVCDLIYASDLAQKASDVEVFEISGNCPQHLTCLAILGTAAAVDEAVKRIQSELWFMMKTE